MTPRLDRFLYKWSLYKKCLIVFLALNVFSITLAAVLGFNYFTVKRNLGSAQAASLTKIEKSDLAIDQLRDFETELAKRSSFEVRNRLDEKKVLEALTRWQNIKTLVEESTGEKISQSISVLIPTAESELELKNIKLGLMDLKKREYNSLRLRLSEYNDTTRLMMITGLITLVFGILLPQLILYLMGRTLNHIRKEIQNSALDFVKSWAEAKAGFGDNAFRNIEFWLQILLLVGEKAGAMSSHPAAQVSSELAYIIRLELQKNSTKPTTPASAA